jgi:single-strand DNA-binding protein
MARGVNKVILVGTCGQDPEVRYLPNGNAVTNLSLATSEQWTDKQTGQKVERPSGTVCRCSARLPKSPANTCKGSQVYIEGKLQTREWEKDGIKRYTTEIVVDMQGTMQLLGGRPQASRRRRPVQPGWWQQLQPGGGQQYNQAPRQQPAPSAGATAPSAAAAAPQPAADFDSFDDDIPF